MNKYEKLIEYIISEQNDLARELFHEIVVEKSRQIYESLDEMDNTVMHGDKVNELVDEVDADEMGMNEADEDSDLDMDMPDMGGDDELDMNLGMDDEGDMDDEEGDMDDMGDEGDMDDMDDMDDMGDMGDEGDMDDEEGDLENRVMDLESALDELKAEFDELMADNDGDGDHDMDDHEAEDDMTKEGLREYVEKVGAPANAEGHEVGAGKSVPVQKASPGLQKANNMGGKRFDLGKGSEAAPDGQRPNGKASGFVKPAQEIDVAKRNVNKPGGNKGAQDFYGTKAKAKSGEEGGVNKHSIEPGGK